MQRHLARHGALHAGLPPHPVGMSTGTGLGTPGIHTGTGESFLAGCFHWLCGGSALAL